MGNQMTETEFERLLSLYGADVSEWPQASRARAEEIAKTGAGKKLLEAEKQLEALLVASVATGHEHVEDQNVEAFLSRLETVPSIYTQTTPAKRRWYAFFEEAVVSLGIEASPAVLMSQAAALAIVLGMGVMVGFNTDGPLSMNRDDGVEIDISNVWFADLTDDEQSAATFGE